jgi:predicted transcriptional regulator
VLKYSLTVCCHVYAEEIIKERGTSKATLRELIRGDFDHLAPVERSTMEKVEKGHIEKQTLDMEERMVIQLAFKKMAIARSVSVFEFGEIRRNYYIGPLWDCS